MLNIPELYFIGDYIDTEIGKCWFVKVKEYDKLVIYQDWIIKDKLDIVDDIREDYKEQVKLILLNTTFYDFLVKYKDLGFYNAYKEVFEFFFHEDVFDKIESDEAFNFYKNMICDMNCINKENKRKYINPEIAYFQKLGQMVKERKGDIITAKSIMANVGLYVNVFDLTIYQLHAYFDTIATNKNYDTTNLYNTVSSKPTEAKPWYSDNIEKYTQLNEQDKQFTDKGKDFAKNASTNKNGVAF